MNDMKKESSILKHPLLTALIGAIASAIAGGIVSYYIWPGTSESVTIEKLTSQISELHSEINTLSINITKLENQNENIIDKNEKLEKLILELETTKKDLEIDNKSLKKQLAKESSSSNNSNSSSKESTSSVNIPDQAVEYNGHHYILFTDKAQTWIGAQEFCKSLGGHLATISSQDENKFLYDYIIKLGYESAYFGYSDLETEGVWKWVTNEHIIYTNWASGEPNSQNSNEDYAMFYYKFNDGSWNDGDFTDYQIFLCEWDF